MSAFTVSAYTDYSEILDIQKRLLDENDRLRAELATAKEVLRLWRVVLAGFAGEDFRGNRPGHCVVSYRALEKHKDAVARLLGEE